MLVRQEDFGAAFTHRLLGFLTYAGDRRAELLLTALGRESAVDFGHGGSEMRLQPRPFG